MRGFKGYVSVISRVKRTSYAPRGKSLSGVVNASLGFYTVWVAHLGRRYGILQALSRRNRPAGTRSIAATTRLAEPAVRVWCEAARALGLIEGTRGGYRMTPGKPGPPRGTARGSFPRGSDPVPSMRWPGFRATQASLRSGAAGPPTGRRP